MGASILLLMGSGSSPGLLAGFVILFGSSYGTVSILRPVLAREILGGADFGAKSGSLALPYLAATASAPFLGSILWLAGGYDLMLSFLVGLAAVGCLLYWNAHRLTDRDTQS